MRWLPHDWLVEFRPGAGCGLERSTIGSGALRNIDAASVLLAQSQAPGQNSSGSQQTRMPVLSGPAIMGCIEFVVRNPAGRAEKAGRRRRSPSGDVMRRHDLSKDGFP